MTIGACGPNLTLSFGVRYEAQTNIGDRADWAPRVGIAWGLGTYTKTVLRAAAGVFYDRVPEVVQLNALRYNGDDAAVVPDPESALRFRRPPLSH